MRCFQCFSKFTDNTAWFRKLPNNFSNMYIKILFLTEIYLQVLVTLASSDDLFIKFSISLKFCSLFKKYSILFCIIQVDFLKADQVCKYFRSPVSEGEFSMRTVSSANSNNLQMIFDFHQL